MRMNGGQNIVKIDRQNIVKKLCKRRQRSGCESDLEERPQYEGGRTKKAGQKVTNKASENDEEN